MLFLWFYHACRRGSPRFLMVSDHINYLTFEDPGAVHTVRRALKLAEAGDLHGAAETAGVEVAHAAVVSQGLRRGMRFSIGAELDNDPRSRPDAQNIVDAMRPDGMIRSVHFLVIEHPEKGPDFQWPFDNPDFAELYDVVGTERVWELYVAKLLDDVEKLPGHIVGHFYVPAIFGHWPEPAKLEQYEDRLLNVCFDRGMAIEVNTRVFYREHPQEIKDAFRAAYLRLMRKAKEKGVAIAIGADAHSPKDQGGAFDLVLEMLDEAEINEIVFPVAGRLARVALRATKEHLEKLKQQEPVAVQPGSSISGLGRAELGLPEREEVEEKVSADKLGHDASPKKRAASPARGSKRVAKRSVEELPEGPGPEVAAPETIAEAAAEPTAPQAPAPAPKKAAAKTKKAEPKAPPKVEVPAPVAKAAAKAAATATKAVKAVAKTAKAAVTAATSKKAAATKAAKPAPKTAAKNVKTTKAAAKKTTAAKAPAKKAAPAAKKAAPKKAPAKKAPAKKAPAKKATAKKAPARKAAPAKRPAAAKKTTKPAAKKATSKKSTAKKQTRRR